MRVAVVDPGCQAPYYVRNLTRALAGAGCDVTLHTAPLLYDRPDSSIDSVDVRQSFGRLLGPATVPGTAPGTAPGTGPSTALGPAPARLHPVSRRLLRAASYPFEVVGFGAWSLRHRPDVVHLQWSVAPPLDGAWVRALRRSGLGLIYTAHNVVPHETRPWHEAFHKWVQGSAARVIVHSRATRDRLVQLGGADDDTVRIVPMPADEPELDLGRAEARAALQPPIGPDVPLVLFFGHVRRYKGVDVLVEAVPRLLSRVPSARVLVCGPVHGGQAGVKRLEGQIAALDVARAVDLRPGYASSETARACLAAADVVALPYRSASDSAVLAAARGYGRAVVASDVGSLAEALGAGGGVVVPPGDPDRLAEALADVLEHPDAKRRLEEEALAAARAWTWRDAAEATVDVYREIFRESAT